MKVLIPIVAEEPTPNGRVYSEVALLEIVRLTKEKASEGKMLIQDDYRPGEPPSISRVVGQVVDVAYLEGPKQIEVDVDWLKLSSPFDPEMEGWTLFPSIRATILEGGRVNGSTIELDFYFVGLRWDTPEFEAHMKEVRDA